MSTKPNHILFSTAMVFLNLVGPTLQDNPCPYPCYPPPTGSDTSSTAGGGGTSEPPPSQPAGSYSYPTTPTGNIPAYNPPPYGNNYMYGPPPPDPILPYFPYYFKKPPHKTDNSESSSALRTSTTAGSRAHLFSSLLILFMFVIGYY